MMKNLCNNCGKQGHMFHQCKLPITSYGIIVFRPSEYGIQYLMIRRKDSFGYIDLLRGKYVQHNVEQLQNIFNEMSVSEREKIRTNTFETLWKQMWGDMTLGTQYKNEEINSQRKFEALKNGLQIGTATEREREREETDFISLEILIDRCTTMWNETEWEFPKGRRNFQEKDLECALREFEEETGIKKSELKTIDNLMPFEEIFIGSNHKSYKHKYFLAYMDKTSSEKSLQNFQKSEVSKIEWKTLEECLESIRPYNLEKKQLIININKILQEYRLY
jgi:8-oxo-dGTP pyrophosphatase MutT (NUDIX family)